MSKRVTLPGGRVLDMGDPEAVRQHALQMIAEISVQETGFHQTRLAAAKELLEVADRLEAKNVAAAPTVADSPVELAAARERLRASLGNK